MMKSRSNKLNMVKVNLITLIIDGLFTWGDCELAR